MSGAKQLVWLVVAGGNEAAGRMAGWQQDVCLWWAGEGVVGKALLQAPSGVVQCVVFVFVVCYVFCVCFAPLCV